MVLEKTLESPLDCEIKPVNHKGNQPWIFIRRTDAETEAPVLWAPNVKSRLIGKDPGAGKDWRQEERGAAEDEMVRWHHWLYAHEFKQTPGDSEEEPDLLKFMGSQRVGPNLLTEQQNDSFLQNKMCFLLYSPTVTLLDIYPNEDGTKPRLDSWLLKIVR